MQLVQAFKKDSMSPKEFIPNLPETFPGGGYYVDMKLGAVMRCQADLGRPDKVRSEVMQKIDILAQELESLTKNLYDSTGPNGTTMVSEIKDAIKELNGQTILLLNLFCMESQTIQDHRGDNDDKEEKGRGEGEDTRTNEAGQTEGTAEETKGS